MVAMSASSVFQAMILYLSPNLLLSVVGKQVQAWAWASENCLGYERRGNAGPVHPVNRQSYGAHP